MNAVALPWLPLGASSPCFSGRPCARNENDKVGEMTRRGPDWLPGADPFSQGAHFTGPAWRDRRFHRNYPTSGNRATPNAEAQNRRATPNTDDSFGRLRTGSSPSSGQAPRTEEGIPKSGVRRQKITPNAETQNRRATPTTEAQRTQRTEEGIPKSEVRRQKITPNAETQRLKPVFRHSPFHRAEALSITHNSSIESQIFAD